MLMTEMTLGRLLSLLSFCVHVMNAAQYHCPDAQQTLSTASSVLVNCGPFTVLPAELTVTGHRSQVIDPAVKWCGTAV